MACPHPSTLILTRAAQFLDGYSPNYQIAADYDLICRVFLSNSSSAVSTIVSVDYKGGGMSEKRGFEGMIEEELIRHRLWSTNQVNLAAKLVSHCAGLIQARSS
jgi:hypothetical protein